MYVVISLHWRFSTWKQVGIFSLSVILLYGFLAIVSHEHTHFSQCPHVVFFFFLCVLCILVAGFCSKYAPSPYASKCFNPTIFICRTKEIFVNESAQKIKLTKVSHTNTELNRESELEADILNKSKKMLKEWYDANYISNQIHCLNMWTV